MSRANASSWKPGLWHRIYSGILLPVASIMYLWAGLTRFAGAICFEFAVIPSHYVILCAGIAEIVTGLVLLATGRALARGKKRAPVLLTFSSVLLLMHYVGRRVFWKTYHQVPQYALKPAFWFWLAVLVVFCLLEILYYRKNRSCSDR